jgi:hypothetical protein
MLDQLNIKKLNESHFLIIFSILLTGFLAMLGQIITQNPLWLFICSLAGFISYLLMSLVGLIYKEQKLYVAFCAGALPSIIYALTVSDSIMVWVGHVVTILGVFILARSLVVYNSWRYGFELLVIIGCCLVVGVHVVMPELPTIWAKMLLPYIEQINASPEQIEMIKQVLPSRYTGISIFFNFILFPMFYVNCVKVLLQKIDKEVLNKTISGVNFSKTLTFSLIFLSLINIWLKINFLIDLQIIWFMGCVIVGLSFVHDFLKKSERKYIILFVFYLAVFLLGNILMPILTVLGILDSGFNLRKRFVN